MPAPIGGDVSGSIAKYETLAVQHADPFTTPRWTYVAYPQGAQGNEGVDRVSFFSVLYLWIGSVLIGPVMTHMLLSVFGYFLSAVIMFLFMKRVTDSDLAAGVAGLIFGFSPHMQSLNRADPTYMHMWLLLLPLWAFWELLQHKEKVWTYLLVAALSVVPAVFWTPYYMFHVFLVAGGSLVFVIYSWRRQGRTLMSIVARTLPIAFIWAGILASYWYIGTTSPSTQIPQRSLLEAYQQAAHPLMYIVPGYYSVWGSSIHRWVSHYVPYMFGTNLYVGVSSCILAVMALFLRERRQRSLFVRLRIHKLSSSDELKVMATTVVFICFFFSLAPRVHLFGLAIPTPNDLVVHAVPALRAGQRVVMPLLVGLSVLAGMGAVTLASYVRPKWRLWVSAGILVVVFIDILALPPRSAATLPHYPSLAVLRAQPPGAVAVFFQYHSLFGPRMQTPCVLQGQFDKPVVNDCNLRQNPAVAPPLLAHLESQPLCDQAGIMRQWGVRYFVLFNTPTNVGVQNCLQQEGRGQIIAHDDTFTVINIDKQSRKQKSVN